MQEFKILLHQLSGSTSISATTLSPIDDSTSSPYFQLSNDYYVYKNEKGISLTTEFNIQDFLNAEENQLMTSGFIEYLTANTSYEEFKNIVYNNQKLSEVFNTYYQDITKNDNNSFNKLKNSDQALSDSLKNTSYIIKRNHNTNANSNITHPNNYAQTTPVLIDSVHTGNSMYINFEISKTKININNPNYDIYKKNTIGEEYIYNNYLFLNKNTSQTLSVNNTYIREQLSARVTGRVQSIKSLLKSNQNIITFPIPENIKSQNIIYYIPDINKTQYYNKPLSSNTTGNCAIYECLVYSGLVNSNSIISSNVNFSAESAFNFFSNSGGDLKITILKPLTNNQSINSFLLGRTTYANLFVDGSSTAIYGTDFTINNNPIIDQPKFEFSSTTLDITINLMSSFFENADQDKIIVISSRETNTVIPYKQIIIYADKFTNVQLNRDISGLIVNNEKMNKVMINGFMDNNLNFNESYPYMINI